ncbi:MAG: protein-L-isoaspartate(D-aspartate) O-methyltransferase [Oligoflexales bacterium]|nr:protein-L-isoaspartate(D-aspartate) O-methyltransferase [Oligoflexales bacterium]
MISEIKSMALETGSETGRYRFKDSVYEALRIVERDKFVSSSLQPFAYDNRPLSIGYGQTISQPYIVALMTDLLDLDPDDKILEVGTGSGYQAAILSRIVKKVITVEIIEELATSAKDRLKNLEYDNVSVYHGDGYYGFEQEAPYDGIIVTSAAPRIPPSLLEQLRVNCKLVIPVGDPFHIQFLMLVEKGEKGIDVKNVLPVSFVPLTGDHGGH